MEHALYKIDQAKAGQAPPDHRKDVKSAMEIRLRLKARVYIYYIRKRNKKLLTFRYSIQTVRFANI